MGQIQRCDAVLTSFSNDKVSVLGKVTLEICITHLITVRHEFIVTDMLDVEFLLGLDFLEEKGLLLILARQILEDRMVGHVICLKSHVM